jgi:hypothetical protein
MDLAAVWALPGCAAKRSVLACTLMGKERHPTLT